MPLYFTFCFVQLGVRWRRAGPGSDAWYIDDPELNLAELASSPLPPRPIDVYFSSHWLAVEGIQPAIPENPPISLVDKRASGVDGESGTDKGSLVSAYV